MGKRMVTGMLWILMEVGGQWCAAQEMIHLDPPPGEPFFGMAIDSVVGNAERIRVTTTGAVYDLTGRGLALVRRIDPASNGIKPRMVAELVFDEPIGALQVIHADRRKCLIGSARVEVEFRSDSLVMVTCKDTQISYVYRSLIPDPPWAKGPKGERMWTDGYGGSLHAVNPAKPGAKVIRARGDEVAMSLEAESGVAMAVFPPKAFDFERLYGVEARPHIWYAGSTNRDLDRAEARFDELVDQRFGVIQLYAGHYGNVVRGGPKPEQPIWEDDRLVYRFRDPERVQSFCRAARARGFKVIAYMAAGAFAGHSMEHTLSFMRAFQADHGLSGWYFDNAAGGSNWMESYEFVRRVREDVGDEGILYHHDSVDVWAGMARDGRVLVPLDAYMDYTLKGETGELANQVHGPDHDYMRYYTSGYGLAQALGTFKISTSGRAAVTKGDSFRVLAQNVHGGGRAADWTYRLFQRTFLPGYEMRRRAYLAGQFHPDVTWPPRWYQELAAVRVEEVGPGGAVLIWETPIPTDSDVRYARQGSGGLSDVSNATMRHQRTKLARKHRVWLRGLKRGTGYRFAIRSTGPDAAGVMRVWGRVGGFDTAWDDDD